MDREAEQRIADSNARSIEHVKNAIATLLRVIDASRRLAELPDHDASAESRVIERELELDVLERELAALEAGDVATAWRIAHEFHEAGHRA